jgi:hypothetical protein
MTANTPKRNLVTVINAEQTLADGLTQNAKAIGTLNLGGKLMKAADLVSVVDARIAARKAVVTAQGALKGARANAKTEIAGSNAVIKLAKEALKVMFANDATTLATLGLATDKVTEPTVAVKAAGQKKAAATRAARGTKGRKQAAAITATTAPEAPTPAIPAAAPTAAPGAAKPTA